MFHYKKTQPGILYPWQTIFSCNDDNLKAT